MTVSASVISMTMYPPISARPSGQGPAHFHLDAVIVKERFFLFVSSTEIDLGMKYSQKSTIFRGWSHRLSKSPLLTPSTAPAAGI